MLEVSEEKREYGARLRVARLAAKLTLRQLARRFGCTDSYLSLVELGKSGVSGDLREQMDAFIAGRAAPADEIAALAERVDALERWQLRVAAQLEPAPVVSLRRETDPEPDEDDDMVEVRYVADLAAGPPLPADRQSAVESVPRRLVPRGASGYEIHRVRGTSMHLAGIGDGALVLCRNVRGTKNYRNHDIVCVQVEGGDSAAGTIKRFKRTHDGRREFVSESDVPEDQLAPIPVDECTIVGRVVARKEGERWVEVPRGQR